MMHFGMINRLRNYQIIAYQTMINRLLTKRLHINYSIISMHSRRFPEIATIVKELQRSEKSRNDELADFFVLQQEITSLGTESL